MGNRTINPKDPEARSEIEAEEESTTFRKTQRRWRGRKLVRETLNGGRWR